MIKLYEDIKKDNEKYRLLLFVMLILCIILLIFLILSNLPGDNEYKLLSDGQVEVGEAIGVKNVFIDKRGLNDETQEGIDNLEFIDKDIKYTAYFESNVFNNGDGVLYIITEQGKWFIEMVKIDE